MSFFDDASLVFLPSGQAGKDGKAYSMKPTNGDGDFTFSRGSNLTATRIDSNGLIEKGRENLLLKSNLFDNGGVPPTAWSTSNASVSSGQTGYDGSTDAWLLQANSDGGGRRLQQSKTQGGVSTLSIYAKAGTTDWLRIEFVGASSYVYFDLTNGVLGSETNAIGKIESVGDGWYRCSAVNTSGSTPSTMRYILASANNNVNVVTGDNIIIQDAQLEIGLAATEPILSGASTGLAGILEDSPRFDYSGGASCPSLLLEPSRTNLIEYSEYFDDWTNSEETDLSVNNTTSPEGVQNAYSITPQATSNYHRINKSITIVSGNQYSFSFFAKANGNDFILFRTLISGGNKNVCFNISNGTIDFESSAVDDAQIEDYGNGWYRCSIIWTATTSGQTIYLRSQISSQVGTDEGIDLFTGNGSGAYLYGAQLEEGSYPTSYIPNHSGGSVTRAADSCSDAGTSSTFNDDEGVLYAEIEALGNENTQRWLSISDGSNNNTIQLGFLNSANNYKIAGTIRLGGSFQAFLAYDLGAVAPTFKKCAIKYKRNDFALWVDGVEVATDTSGSAFPLNTLNSLSFTRGDSVQPLQGNVKQVLTFNTALSDAELTALTS